MLPSRRLPLVGRPVVDVAVGVLRAPDGRVLLAERKAGKDAAGFWELPGGQVDPGESPAQAAARELLEEVGVRALELAPWRFY
ncbi:MAG: NUDIX domain-containing protein, partial [Actinobacteria bacterium]|nr:NUDIX domain-containing protein [Actinomycetota bacterium]